MNNLPETVLRTVFSNIDWRLRLKLESVSKKWNRILHDKRLRMIGSLNLNSLVNAGDLPIQLPHVINSLLINKRKLIHDLIVNRNMHTETLTAIMPTVLSTQAEYLTQLKIYTTSEQVVNNVNALLHLNVLDLNYINQVGGQHQASVDLSHLMQLKVLKGSRVKYINCRSSLLTDLQYNYVTLDNLNDCTDFIQMLNAAKQSIETLNLFFVKMSGHGKRHGQSLNIKLPKLLELEVDSSTLEGLTIDLGESTNLRVIKTNEGDRNLINLDLSVHSLVSFDVDRSNNLVGQFLASATAYSARLCLLKTLRIATVSSVQLLALFNCFSACYSYSLEKLFVSTEECVVAELPDPGALVLLVERSPYLQIMYFMPFSIDKECLINLVVATVRLGSKFSFQFKQITNCDLTNFISDLFIGLCSIDSSNVCRSSVCLLLDHYSQSDWDNNMAILKDIYNNFGISVRRLGL